MLQDQRDPGLQHRTRTEGHTYRVHFPADPHDDRGRIHVLAADILRGENTRPLANDLLDVRAPWPLVWSPGLHVRAKSNLKIIFRFFYYWCQTLEGSFSDVPKPIL